MVGRGPSILIPAWVSSVFLGRNIQWPCLAPSGLRELLRISTRDGVYRAIFGGRGSFVRVSMVSAPLSLDSLAWTSV